MKTETQKPTPRSASRIGDTDVTPAKPPRQRRFLRILMWLVVALVLLILLLPFVLSMGFVGDWIAKRLSNELGTEVAIADHSIGYSSLSLRGLDIKNPAGFASEHSAIKVDKLDAAFSLRALLSSRTLSLVGKIEGFDIRVIQKQDGTTNLQQLAEHRRSKSPLPTTTGQPESPEDPSSKHMIDVVLSNGKLAISHEKIGDIEEMRDIAIELTMKPGTDVVANLSAHVRREGAPDAPGNLTLKAAFDPAGRRTARFLFETTGIDLGRYAPLLSLGGANGPLESMAGELDGRIGGEYQPGEKLMLHGQLTLSKPMFRGRIGEDRIPFELKQNRIVVEPNIRIPLNTEITVSPDDLDIRKFRLQSEMLDVQGLDPTRARELAIGRPAIGAAIKADLTLLAAALGPLLPEQLRKTKGQASGHACFAPDWSKQVIELIGREGPMFVLGASYARFAADIEHLDHDIYRFRNMKADIVSVGGKLSFDSQGGGTINDGAATLVASTDFNQPRLPIKAKVSLKGAKAGAESVHLLRYVLPFMAGLDASKHASFASALDLDIDLTGPGRPGPGQSRLEFLNEWAGAGNVALRNGTFAPAEQWQPLLQLAGKPDSFDFEHVTSKFAFQQGKVQTELMRFNSKLQSYGVRGAAHIDGRIDYRVDLHEVLAKHPNAAEIIGLLGSTNIEAQVRGTLDNPEIELPIKDLGKLLTDGLKKKAQSELEKKLPNLQKGLRDLFQQGKKDKADPNKKDK